MIIAFQLLFKFRMEMTLSKFKREKSNKEGKTIDYALLIEQGLFIWDHSMTIR